MKGILSSLFSSGKHAGIFVSDVSVRYAVLLRAGAGFELNSFGVVPLERGIVSGGRIMDADLLTKTLMATKKRIGGSRVHLAVATEDFAESPLTEWEGCLKNAGLRPLSIQTEAAAAARAVVRAGDTAVHVVVDAGAIGTDISHAAGELDRYLVRRYAHAGSAPESIMLVGEGASRPGLAERLSAMLRIKVAPGDIWTNLHLPSGSVPKLSRAESCAYAAAIGAALAD